MDLSKYRQLYVSETQENLETLGRKLVELEAHPDHREHIDTVFRLFHSIKGMSGTMGYTPMFDLAHQLEELMDRVRRQVRRVEAAVIDLLLAGVDRMTRWVSDVEAERLPLEVDDAAKVLHQQVRTLLGTAPMTLVEPDERPAAPAPVAGDVIVRVVAAENCEDPGMRGFLLQRRLADLGRVKSCDPPIEVLRTGKLKGPLQIVLASDHPPGPIEAYVRLAPEWTDVRVHRHGDLDDDLDFSGDLDLLGPPAADPAATAADASISPPGVALDTPSTAPSAAEAEAEDGDADEQDDAPARADAAIVRPRPARTVRVRTDWLDTVLDRVADLVIISQRLWSLNQEQPRPAMTRGLGELSRLLAGLHADAMAVRMTPMSVLTNRLPRVVRDLCRQAEKRARLTVVGDDQRVDRAIIEGLDAPLTHLLRNAIEHGIEAPDVRELGGKVSVGELVLECRRERDEIVVELRDDGQGIDRAHMARRAARLGLLDAERAQLLAERDLVRLICLPGLSSRDRAGALAGRGVGMDAVHEAISALGGRVEVDSKRGEGTVIRLHLPRTPGISKLLLVEVEHQVFGLPLGHVRETGLFEARDGQTVTVGDAKLPVLGLCRLLALPDGRPASRRPGVLVDDGRHPCVVLVDRIVGQQDAIIKPLGTLLERFDGLQGVTLDPVGNPVFVVDVYRYLERTTPGAAPP
ncbi:MAG: Hpt domain-containing protein [Myxococcales bacterium]|nr:Hpt domain-containing protein [Myxococcales bacterium]